MPNLVFSPGPHTYHVDGILLPSITGVIPSDFSMVPPATLKQACERGIAVHRATELFDLGLLDFSTLRSNIEPHLEAWARFLSEFEVVIDPQAIEKPSWHPVARYAGTPDRGDIEFDVYVRGVLSVIEIKTVAKMDRKVRRQTAAQKHLLNYWRRTGGRPLIVNRWAVQLRDTGKYFPELHEDQCDLGEFLALTTILHADVRDGLRTYPNDPGE